MPRRAKDPRTAAQRIFAILGAFDIDEALVLTATELARRTQLPVSTAHRIAEQCVEWGGLERAPGGGYEIGAKLWQLGLRSNRIPALRTTAAPVLESLHESTGFQVQIAVRDSRTALCLRFLPNRDIANERPWLGWNVPLHCTSVGLILLAFAEPDVLDAALAGELRRFTPATMTDPGVIRDRLAEVQRTGVALVDGEYMVGAASIAVPIRDVSGHVAAALSMIVPSEAGDPTQFTEMVVRAGAAVSESFSWSS